MSFTINIDEFELSAIKRQDQILKRTIKRSFTEKNLSIQGGRYDYYKWNQIFAKTTVLTSQTLSFKRNYLPEILKEILHIKMPNLVVLSLALNNIQSLEQLCCLQAPNLQNLDLSENRITSTRLLRKLPFKLKSLSIDGNLIHELTHFSEIHWKKNIISLILQQFKGEGIVSFNLACLVKINAEGLSQIHIKSRPNINLLKNKIFSQRFKLHNVIDPKF